MMVTGQSLVLYSRLGIVLAPGTEQLLQAVKYMIIVDAVVFHVSTTVVMFGVYNAHPPGPFAAAYKYVEKIQMTAFTVQELIISGLYMWRTLQILKSATDARSKSRKRRKTIAELFSINAVIVIFDVALLVVEYQDRHVIEQALKAVVYSIKLKLEFAVLSKLVEISKRAMRGSEDTFATLSTTEGARIDSVASTMRPSTVSGTFKGPKANQWNNVQFFEEV